MIEGSVLIMFIMSFRLVKLFEFGQASNIRGLRACNRSIYVLIRPLRYARTLTTTRIGTIGWLCGPAVEHRSLAGVLSLSCARLVADG